MLDRGWKYYPALKHAVTLASGILITRLSDVHYNVLLPGLVLSLLWIVCAIRWERLFLPAPIFLSILCSGGILYHAHQHTSLDLPEGLNLYSVDLIGVVVSSPVERNGRFEWSVKPDSLLFRNAAAFPAGEIIVRLYDSSATVLSLPAYGDQISVKGTYRTTSAPRFPGEPDYRTRSSMNGMFNCSRYTDIFLIGKSEVGVIETTVQIFRTYVQQFTESYIGGKEGGIARALLSGERQGIERDTRDAFARTGTAHLLAVSGLHVGIVALALFVLVSWLRNRWFQLLCIAAALGGYVVLTGGRPSIMRAALMSILFLSAMSSGRIARPLNTLGFAGLVLLVIEPAMLFDVGFQLSFAAVAGILLFYPRLYAALRSRFPKSLKLLFVQRIVQLLLLSLCAQLATLPFTLYHFGYVSIIAPVVNLVAVPLTGIGLGAGVLGLVLGFMPFFAEWFGATAYLAIRLVVLLVEWSAEFSGAGLSLSSIGWGIAVLLCAGIMYLAFARAVIQGGLRLCSFALLLYVAFTLNHLFDPLGSSESGYVYLLPISRAGGIATAHHTGDTLAVYYYPIVQYDSATTHRAGEFLSKRTGAELQVIDLSQTVEHSSQLPHQFTVVNQVGPEYMLARAPVLLSNTGLRTPNTVIINGEKVLQVPLQRKIGQGIVVDASSDWRVVRWRY